MDHKEFIKDGGYKSRKFWLTLITMALLAVVAHICPAVALPEVVMGIVAVYTAYIGGSAVNRWNAGKIVAQAINQPLPEPPKEAPKDQEEGS